MTGLDFVVLGLFLVTVAWPTLTYAGDIWSYVKARWLHARTR